eukprot:tig00000396_g24917.t1
MTLRPPEMDCIPPRPLNVSSSDFEVVGADGAPLQTAAGERWDISGPPPHVREARIRHRGFPRGPSCFVRIAAYIPIGQAVSWDVLVDGNDGALNSSAIAALGADPPVAQWARQLRATVVGVCPDIVQHLCEPRVRVVTNPKLGPLATDVGPAGNFSFAPEKPAWAFRMAGAPLITAEFSREVPDTYLANAAIAPGEVLRTYFVSLRLPRPRAFNKGIPEPVRAFTASLAPVRVEIRKPPEA